MEAFVAGMLTGAIMGLAVQAYWLVILSRRPLEAFKRADSPVATIIIFGGLIAVGGWIVVGGALGALVGAIRPDDNDLVLVPSAVFLLVLLFVSAIALVPALAYLRAWKRHVLVTFGLFAGLFGLLLPNLIVAAQN